MTSPARIENTERKRETSLANQVAAIKARREAE